MAVEAPAAPSAEGQLTNAQVLVEEPLPAGPSDDEVNGAWDATFDALVEIGKQDADTPAPAAPEPPKEEAPVEQPEAQVEVPAESPAPAQPDPRDARLQQLEQQNARMLEVMQQMAGQRPQADAAAPKPTPQDDVSRFVETMKRNGLNIDKPEIADAQFKAQMAFFESQFGMNPQQLKAMLTQQQQTLGSIAQQRAVDADQAKTLQAIAQAKATSGLDLLGADKEYLGNVLTQLEKSGAAITYTEKAVIPPDIAIELAQLRKFQADAQKAASATAGAQKAKATAKAVAGGAAPGATPGAGTAGSADMKAGKPLTQEEANAMDYGSLFERIGII